MCYYYNINNTRRCRSLMNMSAVRKSAGLTQQDVADIIGVHKQSVSLWERAGTTQNKDAMQVYNILEQLYTLHIAEVGTDIIPAPNAMGNVCAGDLIVLDNKQPSDGSLVVIFDSNYKPISLCRTLYYGIVAAFINSKGERVETDPTKVKRVAYHLSCPYYYGY